ncbi:unnamed protein product [Gordionus sp. m RMFG-2023]
MTSACKTPDSIYDFKARTIDGKEISLDIYKGKVVLIVNVASLYEKYESNGLRILAFPCNQFGNQEPGSEADIKKFVSKYPVKFDMFSKIDVNGDNCIPLFKFLKKNEDISWNFAKFLINRQGKIVKRYGTKEEPFTFENDIVHLLDEKQ